MRRSVLVPALAAATLALGWLAPSRSEAFRSAVHTDLTRAALEDPAVGRTVNGATLTFSERAILEIQAANVAEDFGPEATTPSHHFDNERLGAGSQRLVNLKGRIVDAITASFPDGMTARARLGAALHALQDFYSHTNWVETGNVDIATVLGRTTLSDPAAGLVVCAEDRSTLTGDGLSQLTSGYFGLPDPCADSVTPPGKCRHGFGDCAGIHKDDAGRPGFDVASDLARRASVDFVNQILNSPRVAGNARAIRALMGRSGTFAFAIDDSASMNAELGNLSSAIQDIVGSSPGLADGAGDFLLTRFGPEIDTRRTASRDVFSTWVTGLRTRGATGDGAEPCMEALLSALEDLKPGATLFVVTDAGCTDAALAPTVVSFARARDVRVVVVVTGPEAEADAAFRTVADGTGGVVLAVPESQAGRGLELARSLLAGDVESVFAVDGTTSKPHSESFPVECGADELVVTASVATDGAVFLTRPDGTPAVDADADVTVTALADGAIFRVANPAQGSWRVDLTGTGAYSIRAFVVGDVALHAVRFVARTTTPHAPLVPASGQPSTAAATLSAVVVGAGPAAPSFQLVDTSGAVLATVAMAQQDPDAGADRFVGSFVPPAQPFRLVVTGTDASGCAFRRTHAALFAASSLQLELGATGPLNGFVAGRTTTLPVTLRNLGAAATFAVSATATGGVAADVAPAAVAVGAGGTATVDLRVDVPASTARGTLVTVTVAAAEQGGPRTNTLSVAAPVTDGSLALSVVQFRARDRRQAERDTFSVRGALSFTSESRRRSLDPARDAVTIEFGDPDDPYVLTIPAGDAGWRTSRDGTATWRSAPGAEPRVKLTVSPRRRQFRLDVAKFDFATAPDDEVVVALQVGDDLGFARRLRRR